MMSYLYKKKNDFQTRSNFTLINQVSSLGITVKETNNIRIYIRTIDIVFIINQGTISVNNITIIIFFNWFSIKQRIVM